MLRLVPWRMQALILSFLSVIAICNALPFTAIINIEPLDNNDVKVRAHYGAIVPLPCPSLLHSVCNEGNSSCIAHIVPSPMQGKQPPPGWCVRQWQKIIPKQHSSNIHLGTSAGVVLSTRADLSIRKDKRKVNRPPFSALIPPIRVSAGCSRDIRLSTYDLDGDRVRCRYAQDKSGECHGNCPQHAFLLLDEASCTLRYTGGASVGQYYVKLMVEDFPVPIPHVQMDQEALSSNPVFLSITVEAEVADCAALPLFVDKTPAENTMFPVLPYEEVKFNVTVRSEAEAVLEMAVAGPPSLYISQLKDEQNSDKSSALSWVRDVNQLSRLLSICFTANTNSLQSEIRCIWLQQRPMNDLPAGTELNCSNTNMTLVLPVSSMADLPLDDLTLNDPSCPVFHNTTHVTAVFPLLGCGTKIVHAGSDLVYTNTLKSTGITSLITRRATLTLPLACRIKPQEAKGPRYKIAMPKEEKVFGKFTFWVEFHRPGKGPLGNLTRVRQFRRIPRQVREVVKVARMELLDMYVFSNSSMTRAQLMMGGCMQSKTEDFSSASPLVDSGCSRSNRSLEMIVQTSLIKVYRLDLSKIPTVGNMMYVECKVSLCVTTQASEKCPEPCDPNPNANVLVSNFMSSNYTVRSGPVFLLDTPDPVAATTPQAATTATVTTTPTPTPTQPPANTTTGSATDRSSSLALLLTTVFLHTLCLCLIH
ncbi:hypothetical protein ACEWY4_015850 [Coilia grayii]|uniref:ZP domain-containing protein n=1 Tax=Coilia grayii TaxID=363190 RepID=A0ABD1JQ18_9TELE